MSGSTLVHPYLVIEGNIGSGKTSLATRLAADFDSKLILEEFAENPFLPGFYENPSRYAFPLELSFLAERYHQLKDKFSNRELFTENTVADYLINKSLLFARINLKADEFDLYKKLFNIMHPMLPKPDLLVFLHNTTPRLQENIKKRGRSYEQNMSSEYLDRVHASYMEYFKVAPELKVLIIDMHGLDFVNKKSDYNWIVEQINKSQYSHGINTISYQRMGQDLL